MMEQQPKYNDMQLLKRQLFAMRNGVVADVLRRGGSPFSIIFGVNLPQLAEIAAQCPHTREFAESVWANATTRESMLIAPMLMPSDEMTIDDALRWVKQIPHVEVADVLCLKLLRKLPQAYHLAQELIASEDKMMHYTGLRLMCNLAPMHPQEAADLGKAEMKRNDPDTRQVAHILASYDENMDWE